MESSPTLLSVSWMVGVLGYLPATLTHPSFFLVHSTKLKLLSTLQYSISTQKGTLLISHRCQAQTLFGSCWLPWPLRPWPFDFRCTMPSLSTSNASTKPCRLRSKFSGRLLRAFSIFVSLTGGEEILTFSFCTLPLCTAPRKSTLIWSSPNRKLKLRVTGRIWKEQWFELPSTLLLFNRVRQ